jgi:DivIVA domain-containing protein
MTIVFLLLGVAVVVAVALLAVGRLGELPEVEPDRAPLALPDDRLVASEDVDNVRFAVGMRGYRMDEVDDVLDRLAADIAERDARIADLESRMYATLPADAETTAQAAEAPQVPAELPPAAEPAPAAVEDEPRP